MENKCDLKLILRGKNGVERHFRSLLEDEGPTQESLELLSFLAEKVLGTGVKIYGETTVIVKVADMEASVLSARAHEFVEIKSTKMQNNN